MEDYPTRWHRGRIIWKPKVDITEEKLAAAEGLIGQRLPEDFRDFYLTAAGGQFPYSVSLPPDQPDGELISFDSFTPVDGPHGLAEVWRRYSRTVFGEHLPPGLLQVAVDGGGSLLFVDLRPETFGEVWAFVFGLPDWTGRGRGNTGGLVARSWTEYLDLLVIDPDEAELVWEDARDVDDAWRASVVLWLDSGLPDWRTRPWASMPDR